MNVLFLDYDGVVNTAQWELKADKWVCFYHFPEDNSVNDFQAVQWVSEFCEKYHYSIVVTSTWRFKDNYKECLRNGGLRESVAILGRTPDIWDGCRGDEIGAWLKEHPEVGNFLIFDDQCNMGEYIDHLVRCRSSAGFREEEFSEAERLHRRLQNFSFQ